MEEMKEIVYGDIKFTQKYMITKDGRVFNANRNKFLKFTIDKDGYFDYTLYTTNGAKHFRVARISMSTYAPIDGYENLVVNHLDGNVQNNTLDNLEWCTIRENTIHAYKTGLAHGSKGSKNSQAKLVEKDILDICDLLKQNKFSQKEIAKIYHISSSIISMIANRKIWTHITKDIEF